LFKRSSIPSIIFASSLSFYSPPKVLEALLRKREVELLKIYDELRASEVSKKLRQFLSHILVCGDTSSGKSLTLEAITEVEFPKARSACTGFATE